MNTLFTYAYESLPSFKDSFEVSSGPNFEGTLVCEFPSRFVPKYYRSRLIGLTFVGPAIREEFLGDFLLPV